jgi:hypothetical protein
VFVGGLPTLTNTQLMVGTPGAGGLGQGFNPGNAGLAGGACEQMDFGGAAEACVN